MKALNFVILSTMISFAGISQNAYDAAAKEKFMHEKSNIYKQRANKQLATGIAAVSAGGLALYTGLHMHGNPVAYNSWGEARYGSSPAGNLASIAGGILIAYGIHSLFSMHRSHQLAKQVYVSGNDLTMGNLSMPGNHQTSLNIVLTIGN